MGTLPRTASRQAAVEHLQEDPLRPAVVLGVGGRELARPVVHGADLFELAADVVDVLLGVDPGMGLLLDGVVLGRQAEGVPAHGMQHDVAVQLAEPRQHVAQDVAAPVADVQPRPGGVGKHVEAVEGGGVAGIVGRRVRTGCFPVGAPLGFDVGGRVGGCFGHKSGGV
jgi:hypothetical protein